jgi:hypothetical protein
MSFLFQAESFISFDDGDDHNEYDNLVGGMIIKDCILVEDYLPFRRTRSDQYVVLAHDQTEGCFEKK